MYKVGVTGGIGSGKSTVCNIFESLGIPIFKADEEGRRLLNEDEKVQQQVVSIIGPQAVVNGKPDRKFISSVVFHDPKKLEELNAIIHPRVRQSAAEWANKQQAPFVIEEAAIMFESGAYKTLDAIIVVSAPEELRIQRVMARDGITEAMVRARIKNQISEEERRQRATFIIENDEKQMLTPQVLTIFKALSSAARP